MFDICVRKEKNVAIYEGLAIKKTFSELSVEPRDKKKE